MPDITPRSWGWISAKLKSRAQVIPAALLDMAQTHTIFSILTPHTSFHWMTNTLLGCYKWLTDPENIILHCHLWMNVLLRTGGLWLKQLGSHGSDGEALVGGRSSLLTQGMSTCLLQMSRTSQFGKHSHSTFSLVSLSKITLYTKK